MKRLTFVWGLVGLAAFMGCEDAPAPLDPATLPCFGACLSGTVCVDGRCLIPDAAPASDAAPVDAAPMADALEDTALPPRPEPDAFVPECEDGEEQPCAEEGACSQAFQRCLDGRWGACAVPQERCDAIDNDCDGTVDEGFELDAVCRRGVGVCAREGVVICSPEGGVTCSVTPANPTPELCNGLDDNCDGQIDEVFRNLGSACSVGSGTCRRSGLYVCGDDGLTSCGVEATITFGAAPEVSAKIL